MVTDRAAPPFTDRDAEEVLGAFGAPAEIIRPTARLINAVVRQHPTLLVAACRYLQNLNWVLAGDGLQGLFRGTYTNDIAAEVHQKLLRTVPDLDTRQLLYRLSLVAEPFSWDDIDALAGAPPPIDGRGSVYETLSIPGSSSDRTVCASSRGSLIKSDGTTCRVQCGRAVMSPSRSRSSLRGTMNQHSAFVAITHYHQGGEFGKAGTILIMILQKALEHAELIRDDTLLLLWTDMPLPVEMDLNVRLIVRGLHIGLFHKLQKPLDFLFADFNALMSGVTEAHRFGVAGAVSLIIMAAGRKYPMKAGAWLRRFLQLPAPATQRRGGRHRRSDAERPALELSDEFPLHVMIWMLIGELKTPTHVRDWLDTVQALPADVRARAMAVDESHVSSVVVAESLTGAEQEKPPAERNWLPIVAALTEFAERARSMRCEILWACFVRAKINVQAEFSRDVEGGAGHGDPGVPTRHP